MWQMKEEDDRRDYIRKDIRVEYERQRLMDMEYWDYHPKNSENRPYHSNSSLQEDQHRRRRRLLMTKKMHSSFSSKIGCDDPQDITSCPAPMVKKTSGSPNGPVATRRMRSDPVLQSASFDRRLESFLKPGNVTGEVSSLMDDDDDDEDELELFDVALR
jgi:hypothetical protein